MLPPANITNKQCYSRLMLFKNKIVPKQHYPVASLLSGNIIPIQHYLYATTCLYIIANYATYL